VQVLGAAHSVTAVKDVSFHIPENEFVAWWARSGSGKSTTAKLLAGLETAVRRPHPGRWRGFDFTFEAKP